MLFQKLCSYVKERKDIAREQKATQGCDLDGSAMQGDGDSAVLRTALSPFLKSNTILLPTGKNPTLNSLKLNQANMAKSKKVFIHYFLGFSGTSKAPTHCYSGVLSMSELMSKHKYINWEEVDDATYNSAEALFEPNITLTVLE